MTVSELVSYSERARSQASFETFALNCCVSETLSEVVLGAFTTAMSAITDNGDDKLLVFLVVSKDALKAIAEVVEVVLLRDLRLKERRLERRGHGSGVAIEASSSASVEQVAARLGGQDVKCLGSVAVHAGLRSRARSTS